MQQFLSLSHPHVMPIVGIICPTKGIGPIILTRYSAKGSLEDVLNRVRKHDPPEFWNNATKLRMIMSLVSGLKYLHDHGIVHRELKPSDLIVLEDGSLRIIDYTTNFLEKQKYVRVSQVGGPSYVAPELYDDDHSEKKVCDPKTDVFSFGLILYELLTSQKVFSSNMSAAVIMRLAMSSRPTDRPKLPDHIHSVLQELITRSWIPTAQKRPTMENLWKSMKAVKFKLFPDVDIAFSQ
jgi:serine/threonine protein kinase